MSLESPILHEDARDRAGPSIREIFAQCPELAIEQDDYNINVTANIGRQLDARETLSRYSHHPGNSRAAHLYLHLPLCSYICHFCNYVKKFLPNDGNKDSVLDGWVASLIDESRRHLKNAAWVKAAIIESCYIGGGTASLLRDVHLDKLMRCLRDDHDMGRCGELTLEGNPDNFLRDEAEAAKQLGFNRFSVGVQSLQSEVNRFAGRGHDSEASICAIANLLRTQCPFNVDMMFGLPYQTVDSFASDIETLIRLGAPTITIYRLRNIKRHKMGIGNVAAWNVDRVRVRLHAEGVFPSLTETYKMREAAVEVFLSNGYSPSPCGWWSAPGTYAFGNIPHVSRNKWERNDTMIALGPGAYGWLAGEDGTITQTHNEADIAAYLRHMESSNSPPIASGRLLTGAKAVATALGFAFKANQPILIDRFVKQFGVDLLVDEPYASPIRDMLAAGLLDLHEEGAFLKPTLRGEAVHEEVISVYIHRRIGEMDELMCRRT